MAGRMHSARPGFGSGPRLDVTAMARAAALTGAFVAGIGTALLALYLALSTAPGMILADDVVEALTVVANESLRQFPSGSVVYVKSSAGPGFLERLQSTHSSLELRSFSVRPPDNDCTSDRGSTVAAACERDDFLKLEVLSSPTRRTMLVAVGTSRTFGQVLLIKLWSRWHVLVHRWYSV